MFLISLDVSPDEETDGKMEDEIIGGGDQEKKIGHESGKPIVGMKRSLIFWVLYYKATYEGSLSVTVKLSPRDLHITVSNGANNH